MDLSEKENKCFGLYFSPQPGGRTKLFSSFVDQFFESILIFNIIDIALLLLRLEAISFINNDIINRLDLNNFIELATSMTKEQWYKDNEIDFNTVDQQMKKLHPELLNIQVFDNFMLFSKLLTQQDFYKYYIELKRKDEKYQFVFNDLVTFFRSAGFNGSYVFIDDYERIPDFQSARQRKDFALELRSVLYDGMYESAKYGFYVCFLVLHAGVSRLISESWSASGMDHRAPLDEFSYTHIIPFNKLDTSHANLLIKKYINEYRINKGTDALYPFTKEVVTTIAEKSENNAARILRNAYELLEKAAENPLIKVIDSDFEKRICFGI